MEGDIGFSSFEALRLDELKFIISFEDVRRLGLRYRGEGNSSLVVQVPQINYIFRFFKSESEVDEIKENIRMMTSFTFYLIFAKLFFGSYFSMPVIAEIDQSEVQHLDKSISIKRPNFRKKKRLFYPVVEIHPDYAFLSSFTEYQKHKKCFELSHAPLNDRLNTLLSRDYIQYRNFVFTVISNVTAKEKLSKILDSCSETMCIELKPKQGWTAIPDRHQLCFYCMNQYFKLNSNKIGARSEYCPMDLFSGNMRRMKKALTALLKKPQNNFRIFKNGELIFGNNNVLYLEDVLCNWFLNSYERSVDEFCRLISEILLAESVVMNEFNARCIPHNTKYGNYTLCPNINMHLLEQRLSDSKIQCQVEQSLPKNSILGKIISVQQLDLAGIENVYSYFKLHEQEFTSDFGYVSKLISVTNIVDGRIEIPELNIVEAYLLSSMAKDLSILIALKPISSEKIRERNMKDMIFNSEKLSYQVNVSVVDVGPKPLSCIEKHWKRDKDVLIACAKYFSPECLRNI